MSTIKKHNTAILGAAFLMATSAVGPGFLTQTATFTESLMASFGFVILISIVMDIGVQLNVWRVVAVSKNVHRKSPTWCFLVSVTCSRS